MNHFDLANSGSMFFVCAFAIALCLVQPAIFMVIARKRCKQLGISGDAVKTTIRSSAIFSIIPSLPILISYLTLVPGLGRYFPWLRLSVVGNAGYETMVADLAAQSMGYPSIFGIQMDYNSFVTLMMIQSISILGGAILVFLFLPSFDKIVGKLKVMNSAIVPVMTSTMIMGLYFTYGTPQYTNLSNIPGLISFVAAGACIVGCNLLAKKVKVIKDFSFSLSIVVGMLFASVAGNIIA